MPHVCYVPKKFSAASQAIIQAANQIVEEYAEQGFILTLRQLYYQFVSRDWLPNNQRSYKRLGSIVNDARLAGHIDWDYITDRTRNLQKLSTWSSPASIIASAAHSYHRDLWEGQDCRVEVWIEKDALVGVIEGICEELDVPYFSCRGYTSQSEMWGAAQRLIGYENNGYQPVILHLGDHDPSGVDMSRDIRDRLELFGAGVQVERIALNMPQIEEYDPPPNPAKLTDARATGYIDRYGHESWELDALEPRVMVELIRDHVQDRLDLSVFEEQKDRQERQRAELEAVSREWEEVRCYLIGNGDMEDGGS